jgi:hypothetical protein
MQDTSLFLSLAEIAGVFVGFGALIAVRSGGPSEPHEVTPMRAVVAITVGPLPLATGGGELCLYVAAANSAGESACVQFEGVSR